jgi:prophage DNA circulation protein
MPDTLFATELVPASFEGETFVCVSLDTEEGHDAVEHRAYLRPGADIEPTGRRAKRGSLEIVLCNDIEADSIPGKHKRLNRLFDEHPLGSLAHPTKGLMTALMKTRKEKVTGEQQGVITLTVDWIEHLASASSLAGFSGSPSADPPSAASTQAAAADEQMAAVAPSGGYTPTAPVVDEQLAFLETAPRASREIDGALRTMNDVVAANIELPVFAGVDAYAAVAALAALRATLQQLRSRYLPDAARVRQFVVPVPMADWEVAVTAYGDARHASVIRAANALPDPLFIPAGTVLTLLPID